MVEGAWSVPGHALCSSLEYQAVIDSDVNVTVCNITLSLTKEKSVVVYMSCREMKNIEVMQRAAVAVLI